MQDKTPKYQPEEIKLFCGICGIQVPFLVKNVVKFYQITRHWKKENVKKYQIYVSYRCPIDGIVTEFDYFASNDCSQLIEDFNLYTWTRTDN